MDNKLLTCRKIQHMKTLKNKSFIFSFQSEEQRPRISSCPTWIVILRPFLEIHFIYAFKTIMDWRLEMCWPYKDWYSLGVLIQLSFYNLLFWNALIVFHDNVQKNSPSPKNMESRPFSLFNELEDLQLLPVKSRILMQFASDTEYENAGSSVIFFRNTNPDLFDFSEQSVVLPYVWYI